VGRITRERRRAPKLKFLVMLRYNKTQFLFLEHEIQVAQELQHAERWRQLNYRVFSQYVPRTLPVRKLSYTKQLSILFISKTALCRSQLPRFLRCGSAAARSLRLWVRIPPGAWIFFSCKCCVLSGRKLCVGLITRTEESYLLWCVWVWSCSLDNEWAMTHWRGGRELVCHEKNRT